MLGAECATLRADVRGMQASGGVRAAPERAVAALSAKAATAERQLQGPGAAGARGGLERRRDLDCPDRRASPERVSVVVPRHASRLREAADFRPLIRDVRIHRFV